jgi:hypothetical protein
MNKLSKIKTAALAAFALLFASCDSWLEVQPEDRIVSDVLFQERAGFQNALNGVYAALNSPSLYGENLTMGLVDVLAQYYNARRGSHVFLDFSTYNWSLYGRNTRFAAIWNEAYDLIDNCNVIIEQCGEGNPVLPDNYYRVIKGEALALRAMLHLDLLRLFGPVWSNKTTPAIPYVLTSEKVVQPILSGEQVLQYVIDDLVEAADLLATVDPVLTEGAKNYPGEVTDNGNDWNYRQYRLNYFAVRTVLARAYLWGGNKTEAGKVARDVIARANNPAEPFFPLTLPGIANNEDKVFSSEVLFTLRNTSRTVKVFDKLFSLDLAFTNLLSMEDGRTAYVYDDQNDYRFKMWEEIVIDNTALSLFTKYRDVAADHRYMIPLVRLSEAYLIAAECEADVPAALANYLNPLRTARSCVDLSATTPEELTGLIEAEYAREFTGEGQLFYHFKRNEKLTVPDGTKANGTMTITLAAYVIPLPESETYPRTE